MFSTHRIVSLCLVVLLAATAEPASADSASSPDAPSTAAQWPGFGGPAGDGVWPHPTTTLPDGLAERWRRDIGSAYSGVIVGADLVYSLESVGEVDRAVALDARTGTVRWTTPIGPTYRGHTGSDDGPLSTPALASNRLVVLTAHGILSALDAFSGEALWQQDLADLGAEEPHYGITTSPLVVGDRVVVYVGGERTGLAAFSLATGETVWSNPTVAGSTYATPVRARILGTDTLLLATGDGIFATAPNDGRLLWSHRFEERVGVVDRTPLVLSGDRLFQPLTDTASRVLQVADGPEGVQVEERWRSRHIGRSHGPVVASDGFLYGAHGSLLVCLSADDGTVRWRHRIYDGTLIAIGDRLAVLSAGTGTLYWIRKSPQGFEAIVERPVLAAGVSNATPPSFDGSRLYLRNVQELVAIELVDAEDPGAVVAESPSDAEGFGFEELWRARLENALEPSGSGRPTADDAQVYVIASDGDRDSLRALARTDGSLLWARDLGETPERATTGPTAMPEAGDDRVFAIGADCVLHAWTRDGELRWEVDLRERFGTVRSSRGCQTRPLLHEDRLLVQASGETDHRLVALSPHDGQLLWSSKVAEPAYYTNPVVAVLDGREQVLVHAHRRTDAGPTSVLSGVAPESGAVLWTHALDEGMSFWDPVAVAPDRAILPTWGRAIEVRVGSSDGIWSVEKVREHAELTPAGARNGTLFGIAGDDTRAVSTESGELLWTDETTWGYGTVHGDHLFVFAPGVGRLTIYEATAEGPRKLAEQKILPAGAEADAPVWTDGRTILVRNQEELVALKWTTRPDS